MDINARLYALEQRLDGVNLKGLLAALQLLPTALQEFEKRLAELERRLDLLVESLPVALGSEWYHGTGGTPAVQPANANESVLRQALAEAPYKDTIVMPYPVGGTRLLVGPNGQLVEE